MNSLIIKSTRRISFVPTQLQSLHQRYTFANSMSEYSDIDMHEIVIRGTLDKLSKGERIFKNKGDAHHIKKSFEKMYNKTMNVILSPNLSAESTIKVGNRFVSIFEAIGASHYQKHCDIKPKILSMMDEEFAWCNIENIQQFQKIVKTKINKSFSGTWDVIVAKGHPDNSWSLCGTAWKKNGIYAFIFRIDYF